MSFARGRNYRCVVCHAGLVFAYDLRQSGGMSTNAQRFGEIVLARRVELDLNQLDVSAAGGPSNSTMTTIENGRLEELTRATAKKLDRGLRWQPGSARDTWNGGSPIPADTGRAYDEDALATLRHHIGAADVDDALRRRLLDVIEGEVRGA